MLTDDDLSYNRGRVSISKRNEGSKKYGTALIRGIMDGKFEITLTNDNSKVDADVKENAITVANSPANASNGSGTGSTIFISPELNVSLPMQDGTYEKVTYFIALGHELIHADRNRMGIRKIEPFLPKPIGNNEELQTFLLENKLRDEHCLKHRYTGNY